VLFGAETAVVVSLPLGAREKTPAEWSGLVMQNAHELRAAGVAAGVLA
jgi:hypothetical protein